MIKRRRKKKSQTNFLPYYYFIILSFVVKKRICFMDKKNQGGKVSVFILALLVCHPPSRDKEKSSWSTISHTTLLPAFTTILLPALQMCVLPKIRFQPPPSLSISLLSKLSWHSHLCPCNHLNIFLTALTIRYNPNYQLEILTLIVYHHFGRVKKQAKNSLLPSSSWLPLWLP